MTDKEINEMWEAQRTLILNRAAMTGIERHWASLDDAESFDSSLTAYDRGFLYSQGIAVSA